VGLGGKRMWRSTIINLIYENVENLVVLSAHGYRPVVFRDSTIATLKMIKDEDENDNSKSRSGCTSTKGRRSSTCMTVSSVVRMMSCCASRNPR